MAGMPSPPINSGACTQARRSTRPACKSAAARRAPPSTKQPGDAAGSERAKRGGKADIAVGAGLDIEQDRALVAQGGAAGRIGIRRSDQPGWHPIGVGEQPRRRRDAQAAVDDDPHRRAMGEPGQPAGQLRIVGKNGAGADHDRVVAGAQGVRPVARRRAGDPLALAAGKRDAAVERGGKLERHERPAMPQPRQKAGVDLGGLLRAKPGFDRDAGRAQRGNSVAADPRVGVFEGDDDALDASLDQRIGAGRGLAPVAAGFETDIGGSTARRTAGPAQRLGLAMRPAARLGPAATDRRGLR